jgi:hypothetical protein
MMELSCRKPQKYVGQTNNDQQKEAGSSDITSFDLSQMQIFTSYNRSVHGRTFLYYTTTMNGTPPCPDVHLFKREATAGYYTRDKED